MNFYVKICKLKVKEILQYRFAFINNVFSQFFAYMVTFINITFLFKNINSLDGWSLKEILLLWALNVFSYGIAGMFFYNGCNSLEWQTQSGDIDIFYVQPRSIFWNFMFKNISPIFIFHECFSTCFLIYILSTLDIHFSFLKIVYFLILILCAVCIQACIMILFAATSFKIIKSGNLLSTAIYGLRNFTTYPFSIYGKGIRFVVTFIIPYAFVSYYPAMYILEKKNGFFDSCMIFIEPILTVVLIILTSFTWRRCVNKYNGTGT